MPRYVIVRDIPEIGSDKREALDEAAHKSNSVLAEMRAEKKNIQWEHSYVADNKELIKEYAQRSDFPATKITELRKVIDPVTAEG